VGAFVHGGGVMEATRPLSMGGRLSIDGETITVCSVDGAEVRGVTADGEQILFELTRVAGEPVRASNEEWRFGSVLLDAGALSDAQRREAAELPGHLNEASLAIARVIPGARRRGSHARL
jgi:hypothetical protein